MWAPLAHYLNCPSSFSSYLDSPPPPQLHTENPANLQQPCLPHNPTVAEVPKKTDILQPPATLGNLHATPPPGRPFRPLQAPHHIERPDLSLPEQKATTTTTFPNHPSYSLFQAAAGQPATHSLPHNNRPCRPQLHDAYQPTNLR